MRSFKDNVYALTRQIPRGTVATYGQIAALAGNKKAARAVGALMRHNTDAPHTPCHRVVAADGALTGYSLPGGLAAKRQRLLKEGVQFAGNRVDLNTSLWRTVKTAPDL